MDTKHKYRNKKPFYIKPLKILIFIALSYLAVRTGTIAGNYLFGADIKVVENIDVDIFKSTLNNSIPLIDTVYNSGNMSVSFSNDIKELVNKIFGFDLGEPMTILNAQSLYFHDYYNNGYKQYMAMLEEKNKPQKYINEHIVPDNETKKEEKTGDNKAEAMPEDASSITFEEDEEDHGTAKNDIIYNGSGKISIYNETKLKINIDELLNEPLKFTFDKKKNKILIYHTHTTESYLRNIKDLNKDVPNRTQDPRYSVVRVGEELAQNLRKKYGVDIIHNGTIHDYPNYNYSYSNSLNTITKILKSYPTIKMTIDVHRDAAGDNGKKLRAVAKVNNKNTAQVMFVVGTNQGKLAHPNWRENLKLAVKLQEKLNEISPNLAKPIDLSKNRYNEHVTLGSLIIEVGGDGNTLDECLESTKYVAKAINDVLNNK